MYKVKILANLLSQSYLGNTTHLIKYNRFM